MDWNGIPVGNVVGVDNFAVGICADGRYEETECETPDVIVLRITIKDGDGDNADDVNNIGDDSCDRCDGSDDWPDDDDDNDDAKYDVWIGGGGGDITDEDDDKTVGVGGA